MERARLSRKPQTVRKVAPPVGFPSYNQGPQQGHLTTIAFRLVNPGPGGRLNFRAVQIRRLVNGEEWSLLGVSVEPPKRLTGRMTSCAVLFGTRSFPLTYPALRAGLLTVPSPTGLVALLR